MTTTTHETPAGLGPEGRRLWSRVVAEFELEGHSLEVLEVAARSLSRAEDCRRAIEAEGLTVEDRFHQVKPHPLLQAERDARALVLRALGQLGLDNEGAPAPGRFP